MTNPSDGVAVEAGFTPGPWTAKEVIGLPDEDWWAIMAADGSEVAIAPRTPAPAQEANAHLLASAPGLLKAAQLQEAAEEFRANCEECDGEGVPELCGACFPLFDDARCVRRLAIAKATGVHP